MTSRKKVVYFGTPEIAAHILQKVAGSSAYEIAAVVTNVDAPSGRGQKKSPSPVKQRASDLNIPVFTPEKLDAVFIQELQKMEPDLFLVVAYGKILPKIMLDIPVLGTFNLHFSLLPKYRGASPVQSALLNGESISGFTIFKLVPKMDAGDIFVQEELFLDQKNAAEVFAEMTERGGTALQQFSTALLNGKTIESLPQNELIATYCRKFTKSDGEISPEKETAEEILRKHRAFFLWPQLFWIDQKTGKRVKFLQIQEWSGSLASTKELIWKADGKCGMRTKNGALEILEAKPEGKKAMRGTEFWNYLKNVSGKDEM